MYSGIVDVLWTAKAYNSLGICVSYLFSKFEEKHVTWV